MSDELFDPDQPDEDVGVHVDGFVRYAQIPEWILTHPAVSDRAVRAWCALWICADWHTGQATTSRRRLADLMARSLDSVDRAIGELERLGAVTVHRQTYDGRQGWNLYRLSWQPPSGPEGRISAAGGAANVRHRIQSENDQGGDGDVDLDEVADVINRWYEVVTGIAQAPRSYHARWWRVVAEWIDIGGPVYQGFLQDAAASGIETPAGWSVYATRSKHRATVEIDADRWAALDAVIEATNGGTDAD